jgi:beta-lactamase class A
VWTYSVTASLYPADRQYNPPSVRGRNAALVALALAVLLLAATTASAQSWGERRTSAIRYLQTRSGVESFAFIDDQNRLWSYRAWVRAPSASLLKAMLMVAYLNRSSVRERALTDSDRRLLGPMIRWSDNATAGSVLNIVGERGLNLVAHRASMRHFQLRSPWGLSTTTARDQARFFYRIDRLLPERHRAYGMNLLRRIVPSQRWGIPPVKPDGWFIHFKGGWGSGTGRVTHQSALLRTRTKRIVLSVITERNPSHTYGTQTIQGVAARMLKRPLPLAPAPQ